MSSFQKRGMWIGLTLFGAVCGLGCDTTPGMMMTGGGDGHSNTNSSGGLTVVRTGIKTHVQGQLIGGDDMIAFGKASGTGVAYMIPSANDNAERAITNGNNFNNQAFAVSGKKIALTDGNFQVTIFDTATGSSNAIPLTDIRLDTIPVGARDAGHIMSGGNFIACRCEKSIVTDGNRLKVIDVSGATPVVTAFTNYPAAIQNIQQVAIDATLGRVVAVAGQVLLVYDIANPTAAPAQFDTTSAANNSGDGIDNQNQIFTDNGIVIFRADNSERATLLNTASGVYVGLTTKKCAGLLALRGAAFEFFTSEDSDDSAGADLRTGFGKLTDPATSFALKTDTIDAGTINNGVFGFGQTCDVTRDGKFFIAGRETIGSAERIQVSTGGKFALLHDPLNEDTSGVLGTDVNCNGSVVVFKAGFGTDTSVAYVK